LHQQLLNRLALQINSSKEKNAVKKIAQILPLVILLGGFIFIGDASALRFSGDSWVARHYANGQATDEFYLVVQDSGVDINISKFRLNGFSFAPSDPGKNPDFSQLTLSPENGGISWREIDQQHSKYYVKLDRKATRISNKLIRKGLLEKDDQQGYVDDWVSDRLKNRKFKLVFWDENGKKYKTRVGFDTFENPGSEPVVDDDSDYIADNDGEGHGGGNGAAPVPEPATMLLLGSGLVGLAGASRKMRKNK
jgi:hypothetical protein